MGDFIIIIITITKRWATNSCIAAVHTEGKLEK
jgi:hypothetical protein